MSAQPAFCVIIPAYNEAAVIGRCLANILADAPADHGMEIIVAANGCRDDTAAIARRAAPGAQVLNLAQGSKTAAINAANAIAGCYPRIYLDADVECSYSTLAALAQVLHTPGIMIAAPAIRMDFSQLNWLARAYYRAWLKQPYAKAGKGGAGCYALSQAALQMIQNFPPIIADDWWIHTRFPDSQKAYVDTDSAGRDVYTVVHPPRTLSQQFQVETRRLLGNLEVKALHAGPYSEKSAGDGGLAVALKSGAWPLDLAVFLGVKVASRVNAKWRQFRGQAKVWSRDDTSRQT